MHSHPLGRSRGNGRQADTVTGIAREIRDSKYRLRIEGHIVDRDWPLVFPCDALNIGVDALARWIRRRLRLRTAPDEEA